MLKDILKKFETLPEEKKRFLSSPMALAALEEIEKKYGVKLALILMEVAIDDSKKNNLASFLENRLALPKDTSFQLARDLEEEIFREFGEIDEKEAIIKEETTLSPTNQNFSNFSEVNINREGAARPAKEIKGVNFSAGDALSREVVDNKKEELFFGEEDEKEIKEVNGKVDNIRSKVPPSVNWDLEASEIINKLNINVQGEILSNRLKNIIISSLKGIRNNISAREVLMRRANDSGMGFDDKKVDDILKEIKNRKNQAESGTINKEANVSGFEFTLGKENEPMIRREKIKFTEDKKIWPVQIKTEPTKQIVKPKETIVTDNFKEMREGKTETSVFNAELSGTSGAPKKEAGFFMQGVKSPFNILGRKKDENISISNGNNILAPPPPAVIKEKKGFGEASFTKPDFIDSAQSHKLKTAKPLIVEEEKTTDSPIVFLSDKMGENKINQSDEANSLFFKGGVLQLAGSDSVNIKDVGNPKKNEELIQNTVEQKTPARQAGLSDDSFTKKLEEIRNMPPGGQVSNFSINKPKQEEAKKNKSFGSFLFGKRKPEIEIKKMRGGKIKMEDVKKVKMSSYPDEESKLVGPIEELGSITIGYFRELSDDPFRAAEKIKEKINNLEEMSLENKFAGIKAWKKGEISKMYLEILNTALIEHRSVAQVIFDKQAKRDQTLTKEEFEAVSELNKRLRF